MKCFYHRNDNAVSICKSCGRGLCGECSVDIDHGEACRNRCEEQARTITQLIHRNVKISTKKNIASAEIIPAFFFLVMGFVFLIGGIVTSKGPFWIGISLGIVFIIFGGWYIVQAKRIVRLMTEPE